MNDSPRRYLPLYEAKMMHQFSHRWASYQPNGKTRDMTAAELRDPAALPLPRYWVDERDVEARLEHWDRGWLLASRDICRSTDMVTAIMGLFPRAASSGVNIQHIIGDPIDRLEGFYANFNTFVFDFVVRQKVGGTHLSQNYLKQLPVIPPRCYSPPLLDFIRPRVLELAYTAWDLQPFARDLGYAGPPFVFDAERRFWLRCELDALYFHLYGISRDDAAYILDSFPIVKRKDEAAYGDYRSKRVILQLYDELAALPTMHVPAPRAADGALEAPDVSAWLSPLQPPPGMAGA